MRRLDRRENEIHPNFFGGVNRRLLRETIEKDLSAYQFREEMRAQKLQEQESKLDYPDYLNLKVILSQEGLNDITAFNKRWKKRLAELKEESAKKQLHFLIITLIALPILAVLLIVLGFAWLGLLCIGLMFLIVPRNKPLIDTKDLLLWNLFKD